MRYTNPRTHSLTERNGESTSMVWPAVGKERPLYTSGKTIAFSAPAGRSSEVPSPPEFLNSFRVLIDKVASVYFI